MAGVREKFCLPKWSPAQGAGMFTYKDKALNSCWISWQKKKKKTEVYVCEGNIPGDILIRSLNKNIHQIVLN